MTNGEWLMVAGILVLVVVAAFFALAETSLTRVNKVKALTLEDEGRRGAARLARLAEHPERFLNLVLLLVLSCHLAASALLTILAERHFGGAGVVIATVIEVGVIFVFAEAIPKTYAVQHAERAALFAAPTVAVVTGFPPLRLLARGLIALANVILPGKGLKEGPFISEEELLALADVAVDEDVIEREERTLIRSILEFGDTVVREVMVPRPDMLAVEGRDRVSDVIELTINAGKSRIPVYDQGIDDVVGVAFAKDLLRAEREGRGDAEVRGLAREAHFVPETKKVSELMREMQQLKFHIAVVVDEYGGTAGLVTLEDLIEELVGEIVDEYDVEEAAWERLANGDMRVAAKMPVDELNELVGAELPDGDWDTVGGLVFGQLGHVPTEGESVDVDGLRLTAEKVQGRRINRVRVTKLPPRVHEPEE
ncbi:MAG: HlyC/CorC family transporter [Actinobacteria bacterium]|nr:HlyC/CorC family transporter [Actinomycetota bacterium]